MEDCRTNGRMATVMLLRSAPTVYNNFPRRALWLNVVQTVCGIVMLICGIVGIATPGGYVGVSGFGVCVWVILAGSFGIAAGRKKTICEITTSMVFSILAAINSIALTLIMGTFILFIASETLTNSRMSTMESVGQMVSHDQSNIATCIILAIVSFTEAISSVYMSVIGCHFSCFCCRNCCCKYDLTTTEKGIIYDDRLEQVLQPIAYNPPSVGISSARDITNQQQTMYQPMATTASGGGNNAWLQNNKYIRLDDEMLAV